LASILEKAREATQAKERADAVQRMYEHNDNMLSKVSKLSKEVEPEVKDEVDLAEEASVDKSQAVQVPPLNSMTFSTQFKVAMWLKDHDSLSYEQYDRLDDVIEDPSMADLTSFYYTQQKILRGDPLSSGEEWMSKLKDSIWKGLQADPVAPLPHHEVTNRRNDSMLSQVAAASVQQDAIEAAQQEDIETRSVNERNDNMLARVSAHSDQLEAVEAAQQEGIETNSANQRNDDLLAQVAAEAEANRPKQLWIPPLDTMDFMIQYKVAMWLKDHDELTLQQLNNIENLVATPSLVEITDYYINQQKVLRREKLEPENAWMKKLRKTLWKGLKPDPIPQN